MLSDLAAILKGDGTGSEVA